MSLGMNATYATKRRKRSAKCLKSPMKDPPKSNPSKRHRERLNNELDHLASLLPFEQQVISKLDKLSILRLAVSYLRTKTFFQDLKKDLCAENQLLTHSHHYQELGSVVSSLALEALNGFLMVITSDAEVFYASKTVEQYLGFHQSDIIHQSVLELIHSEDRESFSQQLNWQHNLSEDMKSQPIEEVLTPENTCLFQKTITVRFRCLLDNTSGFITLEIAGHLKLISAMSLKSKKPVVALFAICTPFGPLPTGDIQAQNQTFKSKHKMDMSPLSMDQRGQLLFGFSDCELGTMKGYHLIHPDDLEYYSDAHKELIKTGTSGLIAYRLLTKGLSWVWLQTSTKIMYKNSKPDFITCTHRQLSDDEGQQLLGKRGSEFKLPYPLQDPEQGGEDCTVKTQKVKKSKSQLREYLHAGRKRRTPYRDPVNGFGILGNGIDPKADMLYSYGNGLLYDSEGYRNSVYGSYPAESCSQYDKSLYNSVYIDPSQYPRPVHAAAYPDFMSKYSCSKYTMEQSSPYCLDMRKDTSDCDLIKYGSSVRYEYPHGYANSRISDNYSSLENKHPLYSSAYNTDMYLPSVSGLPFAVNGIHEHSPSQAAHNSQHTEIGIRELGKPCQPKVAHTSVIRSTESSLHNTIYEGTTVQEMGSWSSCHNAYPNSPSNESHPHTSSCQYQAATHGSARSPLNSSGHSSASSSPSSVIQNEDYRIAEDRLHVPASASSIAVPVVRATPWSNSVWNDYSCRQTILKGIDSAAELKYVSIKAEGQENNPLLSFSEVTHALLNGD